MQYVNNCVTNIRELVNIGLWYYVPGVENIAELPSMACLPEELRSVT